MPWIDLGSLRDVVDRLLPPGQLRTILQRQYHQRFNPLYALNAVVTRAVLLDQNRALVELTNGVRLLGPPDQIARPILQYGDPLKLDRIGHLHHWSTFLQTLSEVYVGDIYKTATLQKGDVVLDLGAHCGTYTVKAALAVGLSGRVIAIEPSEQNYQLLQANVQVNGLQNVTTLRAGVWSTRGMLPLRLSAVSVAHTFQDRLEGASSTTQIEEVQVDTVDNICQAFHLDRIDFIKIDIEGSEIEALRGMQKTLEGDNLRLAIAAYHNLNGIQTSRGIYQQLRDRDFRVRVRGGIVFAEKDRST